MTLLIAVLLGIVQGITEFLPVSSSGHLVILQSYFNLDSPPILFDVMLHLATVLAVLVMFRGEIAQVLVGGLHDGTRALTRDRSMLLRPTGDLRYLLFLLLGTVVTGVIGLAFEDFFESMFSNPRSVGLALVGTGSLLISSKFTSSGGKIKTVDQLLWWHVVLIGLAQGAAVMPGLSRSGTTIVAALLVGLERRLAVEFSFLLSIPIIAGAAAKQLLSSGGAFSPAMFLAGMVFAFVSGYLSLSLLTRLVVRGRVHLFAYYCIPVGLVVSFVYWMPW